MVELRDIEDRVMRLTPNSSSLGDAILSKSGDKLYYMSSFEGGYDLWVSDLAGEKYPGDAQVEQRMGFPRDG